MSHNLFGLLIDFKYLDHFFHNQELLVEHISKEFEKFYIINSQNIRTKFNSIYFDWDKYSDSKINYSLIKRKMKKNFVLYNPKTIDELNNFFKNKNIILINQIERDFSYFKLWLNLNKKNIKNIIISNASVQDGTPLIICENIKSKLIFFFAKKLPKKIFYLLTFIKIFPRFSIRFDSNKNFFKIFYKNLKKNKIFVPLYEKIININHRTFDLNKEIKKKTSNDLITLIDGDMNHKTDIALRGKLSERVINKHYKILNEHLNHLSKIFNKKVVVSIHPKYNLKYVKSKFKNFNVIKYKTRELITKSYIVIFYESSAIVDAFFYKKNIIQIKPDVPWTVGFDYAKKFSLPYLDITKISDRKIKKKKLIKMFKKSKKKYDKFINSYISFKNENEPGYKKTIRIIKENFKNWS